jgi:urease accessory protein
MRDNTDAFSDDLGLSATSRNGSGNDSANSAGLSPTTSGLRCVSIDWQTGSATAPTEHWLIWQLADSAFPTGGFAHSQGLEAAWQQGQIPSAAELAGYLENHLWQTGTTALPFLNEAYGERRPFAELDQLCDAFLSNHVSNRGSRLQGQAFLLAVARSFENPTIKQFRAGVLRDKLPGHFAGIFGVVLRLLGVPEVLGRKLFLFMSLRGLLASAVRLGIIGPMAAQTLQTSLSKHAENIAERCATMGVLQATQTSPLLDILQGAHDRLYSRLFQT